MEAKTLYSNADVCLTAVAVLPVEVVSSSCRTDEDAPAASREVNRAEWRNANLFLSPGEALRALLLVGDDRGTLRSLRLTVTRAANDTNDTANSHLCTVESHRTVNLVPAGSANPVSPSAADGLASNPPPRVTFLSVSPYAPFMVAAVVGGALRALSALTFDVAKAQSFWGDCAVHTASGVSLACEAMHQEASQSTPQHRLAIVTSHSTAAVVLVSLKEGGADCLGVFTPPSAVRGIAWVRSVVAVSGHNGVIYTYDAATQHLRHQTSTFCFPGVLPARLAAGQLPVLHYLAPTRSAEAGALDGSADDADESLSWGPALLLSHAGGAGPLRKLCYAEVPDGDAGEADVVAESLAASSCALPCPSSVVDATCLSPFLIGHTQAGLTLQSVWDGAVWVTGSRNSTTFDAKDVQTVATMPMGVLALSAHALEAHLFLPFSAQVDLLIQSKLYAKAEWFVKRCAPPIRSVPGAASPRDVESSLNDLYHTVATHAWAHKEYSVALEYLHKAGTAPDTLLSLFPELHLPPVELLNTPPERAAGQEGENSSHNAAVVPLTTCPTAAPYEALYAQLKASLLSWAADEALGAGVATAQTRHETVESRLETLPRAAVEYALFLLVAVLPTAKPDATPVTLSEAASVLLQCRTLPLAWCKQVVLGLKPPQDSGDKSTTALNAPQPPHTPASALMPLLHAACGDVHTALQLCQADEAVRTAGWILRTMTGDTDSLYVAHLPWMLQTDAAATVAVLTSSHVSPPAVPTIVAVVAGTECDRAVLLEYLRYCVYEAPHEWGDADEAVQTIYALHLIEMIHDMQDALGLEGLAETELAGPVGDEAGFLGLCHRLLLAFLDDDKARYDDTAVLARLHVCRLFVEKVKVQRHLGDHVGALETLAYDLNDVGAAVRYCVDEWQEAAPTERSSSCHSDSFINSSMDDDDDLSMPGAEKARDEFDWSGASDTQSKGAVEAPSSSPAHQHQSHGRSSNALLLTLLQLLLVPAADGAPARLTDALRLLATHGGDLNPLDVLDCLPGETALTDMEPYLLRTFQAAALEMQLMELEAAATASAVETARRVHVRLEQRCAAVVPHRVCAVCHQPLSESVAQWVYPNLKVAHFHCARNDSVDPERMTLFRETPHLI